MCGFFSEVKRVAEEAAYIWKTAHQVSHFNSNNFLCRDFASALWYICQLPRALSLCMNHTKKVSFLIFKAAVLQNILKIICYIFFSKYLFKYI